MASTTLDVAGVDVVGLDAAGRHVAGRDVADLEVPARAAGSARRAPLPVLVLAGAGAVQALALLSGALAGLDGLLTDGYRPPRAVLAVGLVSVSAWIVLSVTGGAALLERTGRSVLVTVASAEVALVLAVLGAAVLSSQLGGLSARPPAPALALLALAVPVGKLLLADAPSTLRWLALGPRPPERRADPVQIYRRLCVATLVAIGLALSALVVLGPTLSGETGSMRAGPTTAAVPAP